MVRRSRRQAMILALFFAIAAGCGGSKETQARKLDQERASWEATAELTKELSQRGALPAEYSRQVYQVTAEGLKKARKQSAQLSQ
jgi:ABC-type phosphate transport system substrate-binding protein